MTVRFKHLSLCRFKVEPIHAVDICEIVRTCLIQRDHQCNLVGVVDCSASRFRSTAIQILEKHAQASINKKSFIRAFINDTKNAQQEDFCLRTLPSPRKYMYFRVSFMDFPSKFFFFTRNDKMEENPNCILFICIS